MNLAVAPYFRIRSQSENAARELVGAGWNFQINCCNDDRCYGNFSITPEYTHSFKPYQIAESLFCCCDKPYTSCMQPTSGDSCAFSAESCCNSCNMSGGLCQTPCCDNLYRIRITGSQVEGRNSCDWLADYFGLPTDYKSCVSFEPRIENFLADLNLFLGLDEWVQGLYFRVHAPIVHTRWDLNMCECIQDEGKNNHWAGYFNQTVTVVDTATYGIERSNLVPNFASFITGCGTINSPDITFNPLCHAKMYYNQCTKTGLSDIQMALGWNCCCDWDYNVGFNLRVVAPTGTTPRADYLFEPIIGNGHHWEVGGGFSSFWTWWKSQDECKLCAFYVDVNATHMFKARQCRTFDLCCKPLSRYMLAAHYKSDVENLKAGNPVGNATVPNKQFDGIYSPVANLTTMPVDVSVAVQGDLVLMMQYIHNNWSFDIGYNFWGQTCEKIEYRCDCCPLFEENSWALKGDSFMYGFNGATLKSSTLSASQTQATIGSGRNNYPDGDTSKRPPILWFQNPGVDNRQPAWDTPTPSLPLIIPSPSGQHAQVYTSKNPILIKECDIDLCSAQSRGQSHKLFGHIDYTWSCCDRCTPYIGIGFEAEFAQQPCDNNSCATCKPYSTCFYACNPCGIPHESPCCGPCCDDACCNSCAICPLSQWGVWLKCGCAF